jgi:gliding motility-associated-like protein
MYVFNGQSLTASGEYTTQYTTATCDSFVHLYLTVSSSQIQTIAGCDSVSFNGQVYYNSIQLNDTIKSFISGCDSLYKIIMLVINKKPAIYINQCLQQGQSYSFNGQLLTTSGHYVTTFARPGLCDSTVHLYLVVSAVQTEIISGCDAVINNGIIYTSSTTITDTVRSLVTNCDSIIHILTIQVNKKPVIEISKDRTICKGDTISLSATSTTGTINWAGVGLTNSIIVAPVATTTYTVMSTDGNGCTSTAGVTVFVEDFSLHLFTSPNPVLAGRPVTVQTSANAPYTIHEWQPASLFSNQNLKTQQFIADSSTNLFVTGGTTSGCKDTAYSWLLVTPLDDIYIPSGFTPNGDGKNDAVMVTGSGIATLDFKIFNRWGQLVFYTTDRTKGWDGRLAGTKQPADTYVYVVWLKKTNGQVVEKKGTIVLIK